MTATDILSEIFGKMREDFAALTGGEYGVLRASFGYDAEISAEIAKLATLKPGAGATIYPLVAACLPEKITSYPTKRESVVTVRKIVICTHSEANLTYEQRKQLNFKPILLPLYELFLKHLDKSRHVRHEYNRAVNAELIPFYNDGGKRHAFSDMIDGIVIRNLQFKTKTVCQEQ